MPRIQRYFLLAVTSLLTVAPLLFMGSCNSSDLAFIRFVNASPDALNLDVLINGIVIQSNLSYGGNSSYFAVGDGSLKIMLQATNTATTLIDTTPSLVKNQYYTTLAVGEVSDNTLAGLLTNDDHTAPTAGQIKLRVVHASPSAGPLDIYIETPGAGVVGRTPTASNVEFKAATAFLPMAAGSYEVYMTSTGVDTVVIDTGRVSFTAGEIRTVVALGAPERGFPLKSIVLNDLN